MNGVLWVLRTGAPWQDLPTRYPPYLTCHRRFQQWQRAGRLDRLLQRLAEDLRDRGKIDLSEAFVDATFAGAKTGGLPLGLLAAAKGAKSWRSATVMVFLSPCTWPALHRMNPPLLPATLDARFLPDLPTRLIGDRGYDSDALDAIMMADYGIEMIARHRRGRRVPTQDGRPLRRTTRRWKIERLFAWLHNSRRLVTRWERHVENFLGLLHLACANILLRNL